MLSRTLPFPAIITLSEINRVFLSFSFSLDNERHSGGILAKEGSEKETKKRILIEKVEKPGRKGWNFYATFLSDDSRTRFLRPEGLRRVLPSTCFHSTVKYLMFIAVHLNHDESARSSRQSGQFSRQFPFSFSSRHLFFEDPATVSEDNLNTCS